MEQLSVQWSWWIWFHLFIFAMLALDLGVFHRQEKTITVKESLKWTFIWVVIAFLFNLGIFKYMGPDKAFEFLTCYVLEKSLSVDNIFVMTIIFSFFKVQSRLQHRVLFWGILGALAMRIGFIVGGVSLIQHFHFVLYIFGGFLLYTGFKMFFHRNEEINPEDGLIYKFCKKHFKMTHDFEGNKFFVKKNKSYYMTPLFLVLIIIESTDVLFAVDSIPATLSVTKDPFIAYTSNVFAILGLRSLYFAFAGLVNLFRFLSQALSVVLIFIGLKMLLVDIVEISTGVSLIIVLLTITFSILLSIFIPDKKN